MFPSLARPLRFELVKKVEAATKKSSSTKIDFIFDFADEKSLRRGTDFQKAKKLTMLRTTLCTAHRKKNWLTW